MLLEDVIRLRGIRIGDDGDYYQRIASESEFLRWKDGFLSAHGESGWECFSSSLKDAVNSSAVKDMLAVPANENKKLHLDPQSSHSSGTMRLEPLFAGPTADPRLMALLTT
jgi:hypothetical protein